MLPLYEVPNEPDFMKPDSTTVFSFPVKAPEGAIIRNDLTASAAELNILDGATLTTTELNYVDGVTSAIQTQLNGKAWLDIAGTTANDFSVSLSTHRQDLPPRSTQTGIGILTLTVRQRLRRL